MRALGLVVIGLISTGCFTAWDVGGPWACPASGGCGGSLICDDGVCCDPRGTPACPTTPGPSGCPGGAASLTFFRDRDGDGAGDPNDSRPFCRKPVKERWVSEAGDCNDTDVGVGPRAPERCNAIDDDCNGVVDDGPGLLLLDWKVDTDGDGFGDDCATCVRRSCAAPAGHVALGGDCAPNDPHVFPGAPERCNGIDDNCNQQLDDPPFVDVENPGVDGGVFECSTGQPGVCAAGGMQCVFDGTTARFEPRCVARQAPTVDRCGNALDEDCSGIADDRPGCGGPRNLLSESGLTRGAFAVPLISPLPTRCLGNGAPGAVGMAWLSPVWVGSDARLHVWWVEVSSASWWDLSTTSTLHLPLATGLINPANEGAWDTEPDGLPNPVVLLCGPGGALRYVPVGTERLRGNVTAFQKDIPLRGSATWQVTGTPAAVLEHVTRIEIWMSPRAPDAGVVTFSNRFLVDAGVLGFQ